MWNVYSERNITIDLIENVTLSISLPLQHLSYSSSHLAPFPLLSLSHVDSNACLKSVGFHRIILIHAHNFNYIARKAIAEKCIIRHSLVSVVEEKSQAIKIKEITRQHSPYIEHTLHTTHNTNENGKIHMEKSGYKAKWKMCALHRMKC